MSRNPLHRFWFVDIDPFVLGLFRVTMGLFMLTHFIFVAPMWLELYGPDGISLSRVLPLSSYEFPMPTLSFVATDTGMWVYYGVTIVAILFFTAGSFTKTTTVFLWLTYVALNFRNRFANNGEEKVIALLLFFAMFMPLARSFTLRQLLSPVRRREMFHAGEKVEVGMLRALQIHVAIVYIISLPLKFMVGTSLAPGGGTWFDGTAVYYAMMALSYPRWPGLEIFAWGDAIISRLLTWITLFVEGVLPFLIFTRRFRVVSTLTFLGFHFGLGLFLSGVILFNGAMFPAFIIFLPSSRTRELCRLVFYEKRRDRRLFVRYLWGSKLEGPLEPESEAVDGAVRPA